MISLSVCLSVCVYVCVCVSSMWMPPQVKSVEKFVCCVYSSTRPTSLSALKWMLRSRNLEGEMLPSPTSLELPCCRILTGLIM